MARLLVVSRSMALALRLADAHEVVELSVDDLEAMVPGRDVDAVVLDVGEPALAIQTLDRLRGSGDTTPLLIVSGYQPAWAGLAAVDVPGVVVVPLPITRAALLDGIDLLVTGRTAPTPLPPGALPRPAAGQPGPARPFVPPNVPPAPTAPTAVPVIPPAPAVPPVPPAPPGPARPAARAARATAVPGVGGADDVLVDPPIQPALPAEPVRVEGSEGPDLGAAPDTPATPDDSESDEFLRPFIQTAPTAEPGGPGWAGASFDWWPHGPGPVPPPTGPPAPAGPASSGPASSDPPDDEPPARPLRRGWPPSDSLGPVLLPVDPDGVLPVDPGAPSADDLFPPFTAERLARDPRAVSGTALLPGVPATELSIAAPDDPGPLVHHLATPSPLPAKLGLRPFAAGPELVGTDRPAPDTGEIWTQHPTSRPPTAEPPTGQPPTSQPPTSQPPTVSSADPAPSSGPEAGSAVATAPTGVPLTPPAALGAPARRRIATELVAQLTPHVGYLAGVSGTAQDLAEQAVVAGAAEAAALLVPDGGRWRVSGGVGVPGAERDQVLSSAHWLVEQVAVAGRALALESTEEVRRHLAGAPLADWPYLLAAPVPAVQSVVLMARGAAGGPFSGVELHALSDLLRSAADRLESAVRARHLARLLAPLRETPPPDRDLPPR